MVGMVGYRQVSTSCGDGHAAFVNRRPCCLWYKLIETIKAADIRGLMIALEARDARELPNGRMRPHRRFSLCGCKGSASKYPAAEFKPRDILAEPQPKTAPVSMPRNCRRYSVLSIQTGGRHTSPKRRGEAYEGHRHGRRLCITRD